MILEFRQIRQIWGKMAHLHMKGKYMIVDEWQRVQCITKTSNKVKFLKGTCKL
jgi:hypothetical protein